MRRAALLATLLGQGALASGVCSDNPKEIVISASCTGDIKKVVGARVAGLNSPRPASQKVVLVPPVFSRPVEVQAGPQNFGEDLRRAWRKN